MINVRSIPSYENPLLITILVVYLKFQHSRDYAIKLAKNLSMSATVLPTHKSQIKLLDVLASGWV